MTGVGPRATSPVGARVEEGRGRKGNGDGDPFRLPGQRFFQGSRVVKDPSTTPRDFHFHLLLGSLNFFFFSSL